MNRRNEMPRTFAQRLNPLWGVMLAVFVLPLSVVGQEVLQQIPKEALGFVLVQNLTEASDKFEELLEPFQVTFPAPLTFARSVSGLDAGLDESGDLVIALLPGEGRDTPVQPMVLVPISDYQEFATSINADASGKICRVTLLGEEILVAENGSHAMLMNIENRQAMEKLLAPAVRANTALSPLAEWLAKQEVTFVLMANGIEAISNKKQRPLRPLIWEKQKGFWAERTLFRQMLSIFSRPETRSWLHSNVELAAIGAAVDEHSSLRLGEQLVLKPGSPFAKLASGTTRPLPAKLGLSNKPAVFVAGGPVAAGCGKQLAALLRQMEQTETATNGFENVKPALWEKEEQAYRLLLEDIDSCSVMMLTGEKDEPLIGNFLGVATVPNVSKYFRSLPQVVETWNEVTQQSTGEVKPGFELTTQKVDGKQQCEIIVDIGSTARDPNVPIINWMLEATLGVEGKLHVRFAEVNLTTFVFGFATEEQMAELLNTNQKNKAVAPQSPLLQGTLPLLQPTSSWKALISPQGCLRWASRAYGEFIVLFNNNEIIFPEMPDSPPIGVTVDWNQRHWECEIVCPAATWDTLAKYLEVAKDL